MSLKGYAEETENKISGRLYEFEHDSDHYEFSAVDSETTDTAEQILTDLFLLKEILQNHISWKMELQHML